MRSHPTPLVLAWVLLAAAAAPRALAQPPDAPVGPVPPPPFDPRSEASRTVVPQRETGAYEPTVAPAYGAPAAGAPAYGAPAYVPAPSYDDSCRCVQAFFDDYVPAVPVGPSRTMFTTLAMPNCPWLLTEGEAGTPVRGRGKLEFVRISDERVFTDNRANVWHFDGEEQIVVVEGVTPRFSMNLFGHCVPFHVGVSAAAHTIAYGWWAGARNFVENRLANADQDIRDSHRPYNRAAEVTSGGNTSDLLDPDTPLWKVKGVLKFPLRDLPVGCHALSSAVSVGVAPPAFGEHRDSGNRSVQPDVTLALALPFSEHFRLTGAGNVAFPGESRTLASLGIDHETVVAGGVLGLEWWVSHRFAVALGFTVNGPYTKSSGLPTDHSSFYGNLGLLFRPTERTEIHALFSENPGTQIVVGGTPSSHYDWNTQTDADFSITLGGSVEF